MLEGYETRKKMGGGKRELEPEATPINQRCNELETKERDRGTGETDMSFEGEV